MQSGEPLIIVDKFIPFLDGVLDRIGPVRRLAPAEITPEAVRDADALLVRTRTRCDASLLAGSRVRFVGTATIGYDHIDREWCAANGIVTTNAPGCNAPAVAQYVFASLLRLINRPLSQYTLGIVGVGHVGRIVERWGRALGMEVLCCDPPRQRAEGGDDWVTLEDIATRADIVTMHTPLTRSGEDATYHLADAKFFASLRRAPIFINAARGPVVDTAALVWALDAGLVHKAVIDTWEGEPVIPVDLLKRATIATPHIAGYSHEGKVRASEMVLKALCEALQVPVPSPATESAPAVPASVSAHILAASYDPMKDDAMMRGDVPDATTFERLRDTYPLRHEPRQSVID